MINYELKEGNYYIPETDEWGSCAIYEDGEMLVVAKDLSLGQFLLEAYQADAWTDIPVRDRKLPGDEEGQQ
jgi:hypothetical protein